MHHPVSRVEDYTSTCLVMGLVNLIWVFVLLWATIGWGAVIAVAIALNWAIKRLAQSKAARESALPPATPSTDPM